jgi:hypothetical protein
MASCPRSGDPSQCDVITTRPRVLCGAGPIDGMPQTPPGWGVGFLAARRGADSAEPPLRVPVKERDP